MIGLAWTDLWYFGVLFVTILLTFHIIFHQEYRTFIAPSYSYRIIWILIVAISVFFAMEEVVIYGDKWVYQLDFNKAKYSWELPDKDLGFYLYIKAVSFFTDKSFVFFLITALLYMIGYYVFIRKHIIPPYRFILFFTVITSMGFYSYANNTLRSGLALALFLAVMSRPYFLKLGTLLLMLLVVFIHKSLLLPAGALLLSLMYRPKNYFMEVWLVCLLLSLLIGDVFVNLFGEYFSFADSRVTDYTAQNHQLQYKTGFRWDFVIFSVIPILLARYYQKKGYSNRLYSQLLSMYVISNAFWLLLIRIPFSDRLATLSWFLIPVLIMYPLLTKRIFEKQHFWIAGVLLVNVLVTFYLNVS